MGTRSVEDVFGTRVRTERERQGLSQAALARQLKAFGVSLHASAIAKMESRDVEQPRSIRLGEAAALAAILEIDLNSLVYEASGPDTTELDAALERAQRRKQELAKEVNTAALLLRTLAKFAPREDSTMREKALWKDYPQRLADIDHDAAGDLREWLSKLGTEQ